MRNRDAVLKKLDSIDSNLNKLNAFLNQGRREDCYQTTNDIREQIDQIRTYIETDSISGAELNPR
jgi:hypothetical protein